MVKEDNPVYSPSESILYSVNDKYPQGNVGANYLGSAIGLIWIPIIVIIFSVLENSSTGILIGCVIMIIPIIYFGM